MSAVLTPWISMLVDERKYNNMSIYVLEAAKLNFI